MAPSRFREARPGYLAGFSLFLVLQSENKTMTREQVWKALWEDPKYVRLHARKDRIGKLWNEANVYKRPEEDRLSEQFARANKAIQRYEDEALAKAGAELSGAPPKPIKTSRRRR